MQSQSVSRSVSSQEQNVFERGSNGHYYNNNNNNDTARGLNTGYTG